MKNLDPSKPSEVTDTAFMLVGCVAYHQGHFYGHVTRRLVDEHPLSMRWNPDGTPHIGYPYVPIRNTPIKIEQWCMIGEIVDTTWTNIQPAGLPSHALGLLKRTTRDGIVISVELVK